MSARLLLAAGVALLALVIIAAVYSAVSPPRGGSATATGAAMASGRLPNGIYYSRWDGYTVYVLSARIVSYGGGPRILLLQMCSENPGYKLLPVEVYIDGRRLPKYLVAPALFREPEVHGMPVINCTEAYEAIVQLADGGYTGRIIYTDSPESAYHHALVGVRNPVDIRVHELVLRPFIPSKGVYLPPVRMVLEAG